MKCIPTTLHGVVLIEPILFSDQRGWFIESFNERSFQQELGKMKLPIPKPFVQDNHSCSKKNVLRGLHYQLAPYAQGKLVKVVKGRAYDVAVDIRKDSPNYGQWTAVELSEDNRLMLWIPEGFAHGFMALEEDTHFLYKTTNFYHKESEQSIRWNDPDLGIKWPKISEVILNEKDSKAPLFNEKKQHTIYY